MIALVVLIAGVLFLLFYGSISTGALLIGLLCLGGGAAFYLKKRRRGGFANIDYYAQTSPLSAWSAGLKSLVALFTIILCLLGESPFLCGFVILSMGAVVCGPGRIPLAYYFELLLLPASFIALSSLAILLEVGSRLPEISRLGLSLPGFYIYVTPQGQQAALLVTVKALAALSCLYMLSLTTPVPNIIGALRRSGLPSVVIDLMYLIYRYIFILTSCLAQMSNAAEARLGYATKGKALRTAALIAAGLLRVSFQRAGASYDAMLARCYDGRLSFLEPETKATRVEYAAWAGYMIIAVGIQYISS